MDGDAKFIDSDKCRQTTAVQSIQSCTVYYTERGEKTTTYITINGTEIHKVDYALKVTDEDYSSSSAESSSDDDTPDNPSSSSSSSTPNGDPPPIGY